MPLLARNGVTCETSWSRRHTALLAAGVPYTLVLWSVHLAEQLSQAVGAADAEMFAPGEWMFSNGKLLRTYTP